MWLGNSLQLFSQKRSFRQSIKLGMWLGNSLLLLSRKKLKYTTDKNKYVVREFNATFFLRKSLLGN